MTNEKGTNQNNGEIIYNPFNGKVEAIKVVDEFGTITFKPVDDAGREFLCDRVCKGAQRSASGRFKIPVDILPDDAQTAFIAGDQNGVTQARKGGDLRGYQDVYPQAPEKPQ